MADVLVRLDVQSEAYESKLKNATANLQHMEKEVRRVGATFEVADKEDLEFIKSLGSMETHATNASGKIKEMTQSIAEMTMVYNRMSDAEKNAATGQALAASIAQQKGNLAEFKNALADASGEAQKTGGFIDTLVDGLGQLGPVGQMAGKLLKGAFGPVGIAIAAVVGVIHQVVEAFKRNEDAMASAERAAAPFKAMWQGIQRIFDKLVPLIADAIEGISNGIQNMFGKLTDWMGRISQTSLGKKLGLDTVYEQMKKVQGVAGELTASNKKIADSERELHTLRRTSAEATARDEQKIAKLRAEAYEKDKYSAAERVKKLEEAAELEERIMQRDVNLKQKELDVIKLKNSLTQSGTEDLDAQSAAQVALTNATTAYYNKQRQLQRQLQAAKNEDAKDQAAASGGDVTAPQPKPVKDAVAMWKEYEDKLADVKARLEEFKAMVQDQGLTDAQRDWAAGMADAYQEQLDKMTGATEEAANNISNSLDKLPTKFELIQQSLDKMSTGVGAISTLGNSFNELKSIGDDLASAFSGEMDAWDALMTVFNSGIGIMETVIGVMEAINTLQELSSMLSKKKVTDQATETAAVVGGKMAESQANIQEAGTSMLSAGANTAESSSAAGKAVANIPIVGPILAVAAIAAVLGASLAAMSKAKSAGNFSSGGIVPGNSYSGDNLSIGVNSQELVLNRAQTSNIAGQLQNNPMGNLQLTSKVRGSDLLIVLDNTNSSRGGQRGMYVNVR